MFPNSNFIQSPLDLKLVNNTVIIGVLAESPYAEFMGDINNEYCANKTYIVEGCM